MGKQLADQIKNGDFIVTAEYLPKAEADGSRVRAVVQALQEVPTAVNVADNPFGVAMSSMAASVMLAQAGIEPVCQIVTRDRNRIALQSDLLGAASLGIKNFLCLSGYHQVLTDNPESANVYDIDSTQLVAMVTNMREKGELLNGAKISGRFPVIAGAAANPYLMPLEMNMIRIAQKVEAGAIFMQTHPVFNIDEFNAWIDEARNAGIAAKTAILAGVLPLESAEEAEHLSKTYTDLCIPAAVIDRMKSAGGKEAQKKEGLAVCVETITALKEIKGVRGIHLITGGKEERIPEILSTSGLKGSHKN
jgi:methylenetetrahydrofolate reductase (NADPH)